MRFETDQLPRLQPVIVLLVLTAILATMPAAVSATQTTEDAAQLFHAARHQEVVVGDLEAAIALYLRVVDLPTVDRALSAKALLRIGQAYETLGREEASAAYRRLLDEFADQAEAKPARERLAALAVEAGSRSEIGAPRTRLVWKRAIDAEGTVSPDGRLLSFIDWETGDVAVRDLATGVNRRLTDKGPWSASPDFGEYPIISTDGKWVAFTWYPNGKCCELRVISTDGAGERTILKDESVSWAEVGGWSPDGKSFSAVIETKQGPNRLVVISVADGSTRTLSTYRDRHLHPGPFSPDGRYLLFDVPVGGGEAPRDVFVVASDGSEEHAITAHAAEDRYLDWTPDGREVLIASDRRNSADLWAVAVTNGRKVGEPRLLAAGLGLRGRMRITRNGELYYAAENSTRDALSLAFDPATGHYAGHPTRIAESFVGRSAMPAWSQDGSKLAYLSWRSPLAGEGAPPVLVVRDLPTGSEREAQLAIKVRSMQLAAWTPEGDAILLIGIDGEKLGLYRVDANSGEAQLVRALESRNVEWPSFSPDGKTLYLLVSTPEASRIVAIDRRTGAERTVVEARPPEGINAFALSPDGETLAFRLMGADYEAWDLIRALPLAGGEARDLLREPVVKGKNIHGRAGMDWLPDGSGLVFGRWKQWPESEEVELWALDVKAGSSRPLGISIESLIGLDIHPSSGGLAFTGGSRAEEIWVLENFLTHSEPD